MPLHVQKWERRQGADRDALGRAALNVCRQARSVEGVRDAQFYWANADTVGFVINAAPGAYGQNSGVGPSPDGAKVLFSLSDLARNVSSEIWGEAGVGEQAYRMSK